MRHNGPSLWFTRYTRSQRIPITHAPRVDRFYTRPTAVLAAQAPLVTTFATHFLLPKSGLRCKKSGHGSGRAPVTPGLPFRYLHYLHGQLSKPETEVGKVLCTSLPYMGKVLFPVQTCVISCTNVCLDTCPIHARYKHDTNARIRVDAVGYMPLHT